MVELNQQLLLLSAIGADQDHCPMVLEAAPSTCETDLASCAASCATSGWPARPQLARAAHLVVVERCGGIHS